MSAIPRGDPGLCVTAHDSLSREQLPSTGRRILAIGDDALAVLEFSCSACGVQADVRLVKVIRISIPPAQGSERSVSCTEENIY